MYKNQLQELAQRSCFNLPSYACIREGPDHAPRFRASVNFNGEVFESPSYSTTLRQAEHAAAEVALNVLSTRGPSRSLTARVLDETGIYKNLLQETAHRAGLNLPVYTTVRSGPGHVPVFTCTVELAGMSFTGESAKTKKQAEKNAAIAACSALKRMPTLASLTNKETDKPDEQDQAVVARVLSNFGAKENNNNRNNSHARRRDQPNQARRRMIYRSHHRENSLLQCRQKGWRLLDMLMDSALDVPNSIPTQKQNSFVSLVPPLPPTSTSKILPPAIITSPLPPSNRPLQVQVRDSNSSSQAQMQEPVAAKHEEQQHIQKPITEKEVSSSKGSLYKPFPHQFETGTSQIGSNNRFSGFLNPNPITPSAAAIRAKSMYIGGFNFNPQRIAPAVQIRSVVPVCAAAPAAATRTQPPSSINNSNSSMLLNNPSSSTTQ